MKINLIISLIILFALQFFTNEAFSQTFFEDKIFQIESGEILIASNFNPASKKIKLLIHLHGKFSVVQNLVKKTKFNGILLTLHHGQFSSPYKKAFSDTNYFKALINIVREILFKEYNLQIDINGFDIYLTSFSAGFGGIREILKNENFYQSIKGIILLDGLHTDYVIENNYKKVNPVQMKDFLRFARDAIRFKKYFIITHSEIIPGNYSSTTETADYLIDSTNSERRLAEKLFENDFVQKSYAFNGFFRVFGFYGNQAKDHMQHLYNLDKFLKMIIDE